MAQKVRIEFVDDYDGSTADETVKFSLDGVDYEIDLSSANASLLRSGLQQYVDKARRVGGRRSSGPSKAPAKEGAVDNKAIRKWAQANGLEVSARGRLSKEIVEAYQKAA